MATRRFICNDCNGGFSRKYNLKRHIKDGCKKHQRSAKSVSGVSLVEPKKINADDMTTTSKLYSTIRKIIAPSHPPSAASVNFKEKDVNMLKDEFNRLYNNNNNGPIAKIELEQLTILLDKMFSRGYITSQEHEMLNKNLSEKFEKKNEEEENKLQSLIQTTFQYVIKHDRDELKKLLINYPDKKFVQLVDAFLIKEYDDIDGEEIYPKLYDLISHSVAATPLIKDKIHQLNIQMLLRDINDNRYRVKTILTRLYDQSQQNYNFLATLNRLFYEDLLSQKQYDEMKDLGGNNNNNNNNLQSIANIIKGTKYGQGLKFLPREVADLKNEFQTLITKVASEGINKLEKNLMAAYLNELSKQKVITKHECNSIKKDVCS